MDEIEERENTVHDKLASGPASALSAMEIVWLALITLGLLVVVALVYKKYWSGSSVQSPPPNSWSDDAEMGGDYGVQDADSQSDMVEVSIEHDSSDVESL